MAIYLGGNILDLKSAIPQATPKLNLYFHENLAPDINYFDSSRLGTSNPNLASYSLNGQASIQVKPNYFKNDSSVKLSEFCPRLAVGDTIKLTGKFSHASNNLVNLIDKTKWNPSVTVNGLEITNNGDGSITINGTTTASTVFSYDDGRAHDYNSKYLLKGCPSGGAWGTYRISVYESDNMINDYGEGVIQQFTANAILRIRFGNGVTVNNLTFTPQLFDLTAYFGEGNEPTTVAEFDALKGGLELTNGDTTVHALSVGDIFTVTQEMLDANVTFYQKSISDCTSENVYAQPCFTTDTSKAEDFYIPYNLDKLWIKSTVPSKVEILDKIVAPSTSEWSADTNALNSGGDNKSLAKVGNYVYHTYANTDEKNLVIIRLDLNQGTYYYPIVEYPFWNNSYNSTYYPFECNSELYIVETYQNGSSRFTRILKLNSDDTISVIYTPTLSAEKFNPILYLGSIDNNVYFYGHTSVNPSTYGYIYHLDMINLTITNLASIGSYLYDLGATIHNNKIYLFGGAMLSGGAYTYYNTIKTFDLTSNTMTTLEVNLPTNLYWTCSILKYENYCYIVGGYTDLTTKSTSVRRFNFTDDTIETLTIVGGKKFNRGYSIYHDNELIILGGYIDTTVNATPYRLTINDVLEQGNMRLTTDYAHPQFKLIDNGNLVFRQGIGRVVKGDSTNHAIDVEARLFNATTKEWEVL